MDKTVLAIPICTLAFASCSVWQSSEPELEKPEVTAPAAPVEQRPALPALSGEPITTEKPVTVFDQSEIRRLQMRLKQAGFDPGPADGIAGAKTKAAFVRLQNACSAWQSIREKSAKPGAGDPERSVPASMQEVRLLQTQLHDAGFDLGPADGVFGARTKAALTGVKEVCPTLGNFAGISAYPAIAGGKEKLTPVSVANTPHIAHVSNGAGGTAQDSSRPSQTREEIRILQLRLRDAGFDPGPFDGVMGPKTKSALQQYEASQRGKRAKLAVTASSADGRY